MRRLCVQVTSGLLLVSVVAGCDRDSVEPPAKSSVSGLKTPTPRPSSGDVRQVTTASPSQAAHGATVPRKDSEPIIVRVQFGHIRGPCIHGEDGSWAMIALDAFDVLKVVRGRLKATALYVRPFTSSAAGYPKDLTEGQILTLRLWLSDESRKQAEENERRGIRALFINGDEVEQEVDTPDPEDPTGRTSSHHAPRQPPTEHVGSASSQVTSAARRPPRF